jgi:tetratricopeptide (TPR) repeat protein
MASFLDEDLNFFGQALSQSEQTPRPESFLQKGSLTWGGNDYLLESDYDWEERQVFLCLYRNRALTLYLASDLLEQEKQLPLAEQVKLTLGRELDSLGSAFELTRLTGKNPIHLNTLGLYFYTKNLWPEARDLLERSLKLKSDYSDAYRNLSNVYLKMGLPQEAVHLLERAVNLNPNFADLHNCLGWVYLECGRHPQARKHLETATRLNPAYQEAYLNLCLSYLQTTDHSDVFSSPPAPEESLDALRQIATQDQELRGILHQISTWEDVSRQYLILKDKQARRDSTNLRALCGLFYLRFRFDRANLKRETLGQSITWLQERLARGYDYADLRNFLGCFHLFLADLTIRDLLAATRKAGDESSPDLAKNLKKLSELSEHSCGQLQL